jgi:cytosine/adenosine deaminase-related metal-dependent hydrolase
LSATVLAADSVLADAWTWHAGGGVLVEGERIARVLPSRASVLRAARGARLVELDGLVLTPGLVNAHAHLELSGLAGQLERAGPFGAWVGRLLALRDARGARGRARDARAGALRCLATGTTSLGDVDTTGAAERGLARPPLRIRVFRELLDAQDPARTAAVLERARAASQRDQRMRIGLAPHAPYSASPTLLSAVARESRRRALPVSVHWSETQAELDWLARGEGPLAALLGTSPRRSGLDLLQSAGLLRRGLLLVHGNLPQRGEPARIAQANATLVHCPGSHAWFGRERFDVARYVRAGVRLALGTDSLASNEDLDLAREMALLRAAHPELAPERVWEMATAAGAAALAMESARGVLHAGALADAVAWRVPPARSRRAVLEALTARAGEVEAVWVGGRPAWRARRRSAPVGRARAAVRP